MLVAGVGCVYGEGRINDLTVEIENRLVSSTLEMLSLLLNSSMCRGGGRDGGIQSITEFA